MDKEGRALKIKRFKAILYLVGYFILKRAQTFNSERFRG